MKLSADLPAWVAYVTRFLGYGLGLLLVLAMLSQLAKGRLATHVQECLDERVGHTGVQQSALLESQRINACLVRKSGILESAFFSPVFKVVAALPNAPCQYVGDWKSTKPKASPVYQVTLHDNGEFDARPLDSKDRDVGISAGSWGVHEGNMVWMYSEGLVWPPEMERIELVDKDSFFLVTPQGLRTRFERLAAPSAGHCRP